MPNPRWKIKPAGSTWGDFGPDDQLGRLNLVTPEKVKQGDIIIIPAGTPHSFSELDAPISYLVYRFEPTKK